MSDVKESNGVSHARRELEILENIAANDPEDPVGCLEMQKQVTEDVLSVVRAIAETGQSGGSIGYFLHLVKCCALQQNISPLQGDWSEWFYHGIEMGDMYQNIRNSAVFKDSDSGRAYYLDGYVTVDPDGVTSTGGDSGKCYIEFPYTPVTKYVPRFEILAKDPDFPKWTHGPLVPENYLFDSAQAVLDFYILHGIISEDDLTK